MQQSETFTTILPESLKGLRLDVALSQVFPEISRNRIQQSIKKRAILVNNAHPRARDIVEGGEAVEMTIEKVIDPMNDPTPEAIPLDIIYEDDDLLVINKPAGMVVHPGAGNPKGTLVNALLHHVPDNASLERFGIVHRLDKETSGILVVAKNGASESHLATQFAERSVERIYHTLVNGEMISGLTINEPIDRNPYNRQKMAIVEEGREAITHIRILERFRQHTLIQCQLETGRTHQIRVHLQHIDFPIVGDPVYGGRLQMPRQFLEEKREILQNFRRQALHAYQLGFIHPTTEEMLHFEAPYPVDLRELIEAVEADRLDHLERER